MKIIQKQYVSGQWHDVRINENFNRAQLVLAFGSKTLVQQPDLYQQVRGFFPEGYIVSCSTGGEILDAKGYDNTLAVTAIDFDSSKVEAHEATISDNVDYTAAGKELGQKLTKEGLRHTMIFMDGSIEGTGDVIDGIQAALPDKTAVTGGIAADNENLESCVGLDKAAQPKKVIVIGFYGDKLKIGHGAMGGWDAFGVTRQVTKSKGNTVYELDHKPILDLYKEYLGELAKDLPTSGLLFPLSVKAPGSDAVSVRALLAVNEEEKSIRYAGYVPEGSYAQLMKANVNHLIEGAAGATSMSLSEQPGNKAEFAILVDCIGRKLVFKQRAYEEIESICHILGDDCATIGFYSHGEIAPYKASSHQCQLQNQTMTVTTFNEE
jgi:hypothetical protein